MYIRLRLRRFVAGYKSCTEVNPSTDVNPFQCIFAAIMHIE